MFNRIELDHIILNTRTLFDNLLTKSETLLKTTHIICKKIEIFNR